ncbi:MAG: hypothetical protein ABFD97_17985 [Syntrophobacter sp.]
MTTDVDSIRRGIAKLFVDRTVGDVTERAFQRQIAERTVDLYRAVIERKLAEGEGLIAEHHTISSHFKVTQSLLKEPEQQATSVFLTDQRLLQLESTVLPGQPPTADKRDATVVSQMKLDRIGNLRSRRQYRMGEAAVGAVLCATAVLFFDWLSFTAPVLVGLGTLGILHALLLPTRWVEVWPAGASPSDNPILIHTVRKRSARKLIRLLKERARL